MKRRLIIIAICLLLGAVVNVAVAWGCGLLPVKLSLPRDRSMAGGRWISSSSERAGAYVVLVLVAWVEDSSHVSELLPKWVIRARFGSEAKVSIVDGRGWPFPTLYSVTTFEDEGPISAGGFPLPTPAWPDLLTTSFALPFRPIWRAFAINTLFYAAILWLLIPGPFVLRRFLRVRRGLCPKCAYPMGESAVCTECGGALAVLLKAKGADP